MKPSEKMINLLTIIIAVLLFQNLSFGQALTHGTFSIENKWDINDMNVDVLSALVTFSPHKKTPRCERLSLIQTARVQTSPGVNYEWEEFEGQANRNIIRTPDGTFIDHDASKCKPHQACSPYYRDSWRNAELAPSDSSLFDAPFGWERFESIELEACAVCESEDSLKFLGCATWGGRWPLIEKRSIYPHTFSEAPSDSFKEALRNFFQFYPKASPLRSIR